MSLTPRCPSCQSDVSAPLGWTVFVMGVQLMYILCPHCGTVLGVTSGR